jgi:hypothetical protein
VLIIDDNDFTKGYVETQNMYLYGPTDISIQGNDFGRKSQGIQLEYYNWGSQSSDVSAEVSGNTVLGDKSSLSSGRGIRIYARGDYGSNIQVE